MPVELLQRRVPDVVIALLVFGTVRQGAFYAPDSLALPALLAVLAVLSCVGRGGRGSSVRVVSALAVLLCAWWCYRAAGSGWWPMAQQVPAGVVAFASCYAVGRSVPAPQREGLQVALTVLGALTAAVGLLGLALRLQPLTLLAQDHFRLAGTLTYSNATGALLALLLLPALALPAGRRVLLRAVCVYLVVAGLLATQSRAAVLAALLGLLFLPRRHVAASASALLLGTAVGALAVATSQDPARQHLLVLALVAGLAATAALAHRAGRTRARRPQVVALAVVLTLVSTVAGAALLRTQVMAVVETRTGTASMSDRAYEWEAGWQAFLSAPVVGRGPGRPLLLSDGRQAHFTHNEPLQLAVDVGAVGLALALALVVAVVVGARRRGAPRWVHGSLLTLLVCGLLDFPWHIPVILGAAGLVAALGRREVVADPRALPAGCVLPAPSTVPAPA